MFCAVRAIMPGTWRPPRWRRASDALSSSRRRRRCPRSGVRGARWGRRPPSGGRCWWPARTSGHDPDCIGGQKAKQGHFAVVCPSEQGELSCPRTPLGGNFVLKSPGEVAIRHHIDVAEPELSQSCQPRAAKRDEKGPRRARHRRHHHHRRHHQLLLHHHRRPTSLHELLLASVISAALRARSRLRY